MRERGIEAFKRGLRYGDMVRGEIEKEVRENSKRKQPNSKGPRAIFVQKYNETRRIEDAKKALVDAGFEIKSFDDRILKSWIEERKNDGR